MRRLSNEVFESLKITFSHLVVVNIVDINIRVFKDQCMLVC